MHIINGEQEESCNCTSEKPHGGEKMWKIAFSYVVIALMLILVVEAIYIRKKYPVTRQRNVIFIYSAITSVGYISMVFYELLSSFELSCWLIIIFYLVHYASFYWVGIIYILSRMMGSVKDAFIVNNKQKLYTVLKVILYVSGANGLLISIFMARNLCGLSGATGYYLNACFSVFGGFLLMGFLIFKYVFIRLYIKELYENHLCYYTILLAYLIISVILGIIYYSAFYRFGYEHEGRLIFSLAYSFIILAFPLIILMYFTQLPPDFENSNLQY